MRNAAVTPSGVRPATHRLPVAAWITLLVAGVALGPAALFGGFLLASSPDGSAMQMPIHWLEGTPFPDYFVPGLILLVVFGIGSYVVVAAGFLHSAAAPHLGFALGAGQLIWIGVQLAMIRTWHPVMHPALIAVGAILAASSYLWWRARQSSG